MIPEYRVTLINGDVEYVSAYNVEFHETHVAFSNTTLVRAYRSASVEKIERYN